MGSFFSGSSHAWGQNPDGSTTDRPVNAPAPTDTIGGAGSTALTPTPPDSSALASSNAALTAQQAADRQRKRAAAGLTLLNTPSSQNAPRAQLVPKTLVGGNY